MEFAALCELSFAVLPCRPPPFSFPASLRFWEACSLYALCFVCAVGERARAMDRLR